MLNEPQVASYEEIRRYWDIVEVVDANLILDVRAKAQAKEMRRLRNMTKAR